MELIKRQRQILRELGKLVSLRECLSKNATAFYECGVNVNDTLESLNQQQAKKLAEAEAVFATWC